MGNNITGDLSSSVRKGMMKGRRGRIKNKEFYSSLCTFRARNENFGTGCENIWRGERKLWFVPGYTVSSGALSEDVWL